MWHCVGHHQEGMMTRHFLLVPANGADIIRCGGDGAVDAGMSVGQRVAGALYTPACALLLEQPTANMETKRV